MPQTDSATPTRIDSIQDALVGQKLRLAGRRVENTRLLNFVSINFTLRMMCYSGESGLIVLEYKNKAVMVDVSLTVGPSSRWVNEKFNTVMVIGHLEQSTIALPVPEMPTYANAPQIDPHLVLYAILAIPAFDLDLGLWNSTIENLNENQS
ncbi:hypothetical protein K435DRAFT_855948 [Dendrothele bispora CBS 962.96]|uniref:Uncharacterized protein n=1 Tax=Dendrothele bispora (strain CBS 962.96) TaxID=1314807 RepID=A0A4S8M9P3_DENBC|nr:hypothetical protein K435DRAFT_855948 [Dendrothele bispora CBS 962.96]